MSFQIKWDVLDAEIAETVRSYLDETLQESLATAKPAFLGYLRVLEFDFGTIPPEITIKDLCQPLPEFYIRDDESQSTDDISDVASRLARSRLQSPEAQSIQFSHNRLASSLSSPPSPFKPLDRGFPSLGNSINATSFPSTLASNFLVSNNPTPEPIPPNQMDMQLEFNITYNGNMRLKVATELIINQPTFAFMTLPMTLTLTGFNMAVTGVVAYLGDRICFCLKEQVEEEGKQIGILEHISIESEIGDQGKQVLKNVGKIERFIVDQVRKVVTQHLYPNFTVIDLEEEAE